MSRLTTAAHSAGWRGGAWRSLAASHRALSRVLATTLAWTSRGRRRRERDVGDEHPGKPAPTPLPSSIGTIVQGLLPMIATSELAAGRVRDAGDPGCRAHTISEESWRRLPQAGNVSNGLLHPRDAPNAFSMGASGPIARGKPGGGYEESRWWSSDGDVDSQLKNPQLIC